MDGVTDQAFMKDKKQTTSLAWVWILIVLFIVAASIFFIVKMNQTPVMV